MGKERVLVWHDEFGYSGLPDETKWDYEVGMIRGTELQYYTRKRFSNVFVANGNLTIRAKKEIFPNPDLSQFKAEKFPTKYLHTPKDSIPGWVKNRFDSSFNYTSGSLITLHRASWTFGRIEVRAKLPSGNGVWPIIWMMGSNIESVPWPYCGEIDIMEYVGRLPNTIQANVHYSLRENQKKYSSAKKVNIFEPFSDFHVYSMEWNEMGMRFFLDDILFHSFTYANLPTDQENPFKKPMYLLLSLAIGGSFGGPVDNSILPQELKVDYVRVYQ